MSSPILSAHLMMFCAHRVQLITYLVATHNTFTLSRSSFHCDSCSVAVLVCWRWCSRYLIRSC